MRSQLRRTFRHVAGLCAGIMLLAQASAVASSSGGLTLSTSIIGSAWKSDNTPLPNAKLRLRSADTGKIQATTVANEAGQFVFSGIESGSYIVELASDGGKLLAVSHTLMVGPGETVATFVRTGTRVPWFTGFFANAATAVSLAAASIGVTAVAPEEMRPVSREK